MIFQYGFLGQLAFVLLYCKCIGDFHFHGARNSLGAGIGDGVPPCGSTYRDGTDAAAAG